MLLICDVVVAAENCHVAFSFLVLRRLKGQLALLVLLGQFPLLVLQGRLLALGPPVGALGDRRVVVEGEELSRLISVDVGQPEVLGQLLMELVDLLPLLMDQRFDIKAELPPERSLLAAVVGIRLADELPPRLNR